MEGLEAFDAKVHFTNITLEHSSVGPNIPVWIQKMAQRAAWLLCSGWLRVVYIIIIKPYLKSSCGKI